MQRNPITIESLATSKVDIARLLAPDQSPDQAGAWHLRELFADDPELNHEHSTKAYIRHCRRVQRLHA